LYHEPMAGQPFAVGVECYAGYRGEQTPRTLTIGGRRVAVAHVQHNPAKSDARPNMRNGRRGRAMGAGFPTNPSPGRKSSCRCCKKPSRMRRTKSCQRCSTVRRRGRV
jgi:hypothetical protein